MNAIPDKFAQWDAAYVLGALSPAERREFEEHLAGCPICQAAVSELAAVPGLLAQVSPADAAMLPMADDGAAEYTETPSVERCPGRGDRGSAAIAAAEDDQEGTGAAASDGWPQSRGSRQRFILVISGVAVGTGLLPLGPDVSHRVAFSPVVPSGITAVADVIPVQDGTQIKVECVYAEVNDPRPGGGHETYSIFVVDRSGHASEIKEWPATPNKQMRPSGTDTAEGLPDR